MVTEHHVELFRLALERHEADDAKALDLAGKMLALVDPKADLPPWRATINWGDGAEAPAESTTLKKTEKSNVEPELEPEPEPEAAPAPASTSTLPWRVQDPELIRLVALGEPAPEIARKLGRTPGAVYQRISVLRKDGRIPPSDRSTAEAETEETEEPSDFGAAPVTVEDRRAEVDKNLAEVEGPQPAASTLEGKERDCLRCGTTFFSEHAGRRYCTPCRNWVRTHGDETGSPHAIGKN